jgi:hypothetical protein
MEMLSRHCGQGGPGELAERILGWKVCPDRFIKSGRTWIPKHRFRPLARLEEAFLLLDRTAGSYTLSSVRGLFTAEVRVGNRTGKATGEPKAKTITLALAQALGIEAPR